MIILIAGPSGAGKSTLIHEFAKYKNIEIIVVDVLSKSNRNYTGDLSRNLIDSKTFFANKHSGKYKVIHNYDGAIYGYTIPTDCNNKHYVLDYAGEYPICAEMKNYYWKGILVLPPNKDILINRLILTKRQARIESACNEYQECLLELKEDLYVNWLTYISNDAESLENFVKQFIVRYLRN